MRHDWSKTSIGEDINSCYGGVVRVRLCSSKDIAGDGAAKHRIRETGDIARARSQDNVACP